MKGYHKNEQATKESMNEDGFYKTGDLGCYKHGFGLYINDRIKELIKVNIIIIIIILAFSLLLGILAETSAYLGWPSSPMFP